MQLVTIVKAHKLNRDSVVGTKDKNIKKEIEWLPPLGIEPRTSSSTENCTSDALYH